MNDPLADDIIARARWARDTNNSRPNSAWSTGERLFVALVLRNRNYLQEEDYTEAQVKSRLAAEIFTDVAEWLRAVRTALAQDP